MKQLEHQIQAGFFKYLNLQYKFIRPCIFAIPNGGHRHIAVAKKMKDEGVTAGVFDVFVAIPSNHFHGLWMEFKAGKNKITQAQEEFKKRMLTMGYACAVVYSIDEAIEELQRYLAL